MKNKLKTKKITIPKSFLLFALLSLLFWISIKLSKEYKTTLSFPVEYVNLPQDKLLEKQSVDEIEIAVKGTGYKILSRKFDKKKIKLNAQFLQKKARSKYYFLLKNQQAEIQKQLKSGIEIDFFLKDSLFLDLGYLISKKVPVISHLDLQYKFGYELSDKLTIIPDSITISGPQANIDSIVKLDLQKLVLLDVASNINKENNIITPQNVPNLKLSTTKVLLKGEVEKFTEGTFEIPFEIENVPVGVVVNTFPKTLKVVFKVGLSSFNKVDVNSFKIVCDYRISELNNYTHLIPIIISQSSLVKSVRIVPDKVDFLIQK